jgi:hypothetical protein
VKKYLETCKIIRKVTAVRMNTRRITMKNMRKLSAKILQTVCSGSKGYIKQQLMSTDEADVTRISFLARSC